MLLEDELSLYECETELENTDCDISKSLTSGRTNDKQGSENDASIENSPTPISLRRSRL